MDGKMKLPIAEKGYDIAAADAYISMLQEEYNKLYAWGSELEKRTDMPAGETASSEEIEALRTQNRSLYNNCVAFAKHIKRLEKLRDEQGRYMVDELNAAESRKKCLEKEIADLEAKKGLLEVSNESARGQADGASEYGHQRRSAGAGKSDSRRGAEKGRVHTPRAYRQNVGGVRPAQRYVRQGRIICNNNAAVCRKIAAFRRKRPLLFFYPVKSSISL